MIYQTETLNCEEMHVKDSYNRYITIKRRLALFTCNYNFDKMVNCFYLIISLKITL